MDPLNSLVFDRSPTPMWVKDYSAVKKQLDLWRQQGIVNLREFLEQDPSHAINCASLVKVIKVNHKTLELFEAKNFEDFLQYSDTLVACDFHDIYIELLTQIWETGEFTVHSALHHSLSGRDFYLRVRGYVLPESADSWAQVLVSTEDLTSYQKALQREELNRKLAESFFNHSPAALLIVDFQPIKSMMDQLRDEGITELNHYLDQQSEFINNCLESLHILDANQSALDLFCAPDSSYLIGNHQRTLLAPNMAEVMRHNLIHMWKGQLSTKQETIFIDLAGHTHYIYLQLTVLPNYEHDWARVQVALTDITAMKQAEQRLKFASEHDSLTNVYNRTYYAQELQRLELVSQDTDLSCIFIDINGLKEMNDQYGHEAGDNLIIQTAQILQQLVKGTQFTLNRIGGDEFVILMPSVNADALHHYIEKIHTLVRNENQQGRYSLSFSMGFTTRQPHETIKEMLHRADQLMYENKQIYYQTHDRRLSTAIQNI